MGTIKDRHGMDLTEAEDIKKRWQEYREEVVGWFCGCVVVWLCGFLEFLVA